MNPPQTQGLNLVGWFNEISHIMLQIYDTMSKFEKNYRFLIKIQDSTIVPKVFFLMFQ